MRPFFAIAALICAATSNSYAQTTPSPTPQPAGEAKPADVPEPSTSTDAQTRAPDAAPGIIQIPSPEGSEAVAAGFRISFDGFLRFGLTCIQADGFCGVPVGCDGGARVAPFVGRNDGFVFGGARLNLRGNYGERLYVRLGFDGAVASGATPTNPVGRLDTGLRDAYMRYTFAKAANLYVGRFKPPFDVEELTSERDLGFVQRSLESRGVEPYEGLGGELSGFRPGRQLGLMLGSDQATSLGPVNLGYALAVTNGNRGDASLNDNDVPAVWGRLAFGWGETGSSMEVKADEEGPATYRLREGGQVGLSGFYNEQTFGEAPNRFRDRVIGAGVDLSVQYLIFVLRGQLLGQRIAHLLRDSSSDVTAVGGHAQLHVRVIPSMGLYPGYRFAFYNPNRTAGDSQVQDYAQVMHHTVGVRYASSELPMVFMVEYTLSQETGGRETPNDRFEAAMQVDFE